MKENDIVYGFKLTSKKYIDDIDTTLYEFHHEYSGATLVYLENEDTNKTFMAGFRTLPENSTGVCHIIEHSLLCGSTKYPLKEPFVNLLKGSMSTFLNAFTASDWTAYPVASQNDKDFDNLMATYLDAVFSPLSIVDEKPFLQEGWHYELTDVNGTPELKGVVYNEMKGAMSDVDEQLRELTNASFYKDSGYGVNSGGDPEVIPSLTYDYYKDFYKKHYHPENGLLFLYGKMDIEAKLKFINDEYLVKFKATGHPTVIDMPKALINTNVCGKYAINENEDEAGNTYMQLAYALDSAANTRDITAFNILVEALTSTNDSPLKKAMLDAKLGEDVDFYVNDSCILPCLYVTLRKTNDDMKEKFLNTFIDSLKKLIENGIDKGLLLATLNNSLFRVKEMDMGRTPKGLNYAMGLMSNFDYNLPFENALKYSEMYDFFKKNLDNNYFESLITKYLLNSKHYTLATLSPSKTLAKEKADAMQRHMEQLKNNWTKEEKEFYVKQTADLIAYQSKKDTEEELKTLPTLDLSDISTDVNTLNVVESKLDNVTVFEHNFSTNKIAYLNMYFNLKEFKLEEIPYVIVLSDVLAKLDTKKFNAQELTRYIKTYLGKVSFSLLQGANSKDDLNAYLAVKVSSLAENVNYIPEVLNEILNNTIFDEAKIKVLLSQFKNYTRDSIIQNGMQLAMSGAAESSSVLASLTSYETGYNKYNFLSNALDDVSSFVFNLTAVYKKLFNKNAITISASGDEQIIADLKNVFTKLEMPSYDAKDNLKAEIKAKACRALAIPSEVNYNAMSFNLAEEGIKFNGNLNILSHIVRYDYLWPEVRVKGGAYGCSIQIGNYTGDVTLGSYRDPNVALTYKNFMGVAEYLKNLEVSDDEYKSYLIGAIGGFDQPESNSVKIHFADFYKLIGITDEARINIKREMLNTKLSDVKAYYKLFESMAKKASQYTIGNGKKVTEQFNESNIQSL